MTDHATPTAPSSVQPGLEPYDALVLVSFGGPEAPDQVVPFLQNVTRGRGIPEERLREVGQHYYEFGGRSPINDQCRALLAALRTELDTRGLDLPVYWGNRNWEPYLGDTFRQLVADGHRRVLAVITSAYPSYSSCRQYRENLWDAVDGLEVEVDRLRHYSPDPGFVAANTRAVLAAVGELEDPADGGGAGGPEPARLVFVTHSVPTAMAEGSGPPPRSEAGGYVDWHRAVADEITRRVSAETGREHRGDLVFCSRSGPPSQPWLEPDVNDHLRALAAEGVTRVVLSPIGFISDHMEVIYDLDTEAMETAGELGLHCVRAATAGTDHDFVAGLVDLALERAAVARDEPVEPVVIPGGRVGPYRCVPGCCPNLRDPDRPALCGQDSPARAGSLRSRRGAGRALRGRERPE
ncbi:ferrochelatase [Friedmanniella endophytica]|uniref:Coproporphyrin III ferrochelatase n=1 Tax=Microlunatus kandeliicorticis TaxID=1759536 RepID=A0A7W3P7V1_9ACTN|nr:ferrochelatase [Microlunatus kandeliicorticis]MBA8796317.1 ferrochelatase [Microlunatus kandeliicorticis]